MKSLTRRALRVFAVLEHYRAGSSDILEALLPFFEPLFAELFGSTFDPGAFADRVKSAYHWSVTKDVIEELIPRFAAHQWLEKIAGTEHDAVYRVSYTNQDSIPGELQTSQVEEVLAALATEFSAFATSLSPLTTFSRTLEEFADMLVEWVISIDAYTEDVLRQTATQMTIAGDRLGLTVDLPDSSALTTEERYLCARFVKFLFEQKSPHIRDLCEIASIGLLTEVIQDFQKPVTTINKTTVFIYLDAPVALDLIGTSGTAAADNIRPIMTKLVEIGATIRIFRMRGDKQSRDLFQVGHLLVTRNGALAQLGRRFCIEEGLISANSVGPAVHQRQLATAVWLRTGLSDSEQQVPRRYLLAACERVLELKKGVVDQVRLTARKLTPATADQLELLLSEDRSVQVLMDKTLGVSNIVSSSNIEGLIDSMRQSLTETVEREAAEKVALANRRGESSARRAHEARRAAEQRAASLEGSLAAFDAEAQVIVCRLMEEINRGIRIRRWLLKLTVAIVVMLVGLSPFIMESLDNWIKLTLGAWVKPIWLFLLGIVEALLMFFHILDRPIGFDRYLENWAKKALRRRGIARGLDAKLARYHVQYSRGKLNVLLPQGAEEGFQLAMPG